MRVLGSITVNFVTFLKYFYVITFTACLQPLDYILITYS